VREANSKSTEGYLALEKEVLCSRKHHHGWEGKVRGNAQMPSDSSQGSVWHLTFWCRIVLTAAQERWRRQVDFPMHRHSVQDGTFGVTTQDPACEEIGCGRCDAAVNASGASH